MAFSSWRLVLAGLSRHSSRPLQALHDRAAHHPVLVALAEEAQLLRELGDALAIARLGERIGEIGAPIAALRAVGVEDALQMHRDVAKWIWLARDTGRGRQLDADIGVFCKRDGLPDRSLEPAVVGHGHVRAHMVDDQHELRMLSGNLAERRGAA